MSRGGDFRREGGRCGRGVHDLSVPGALVSFADGKSRCRACHNESCRVAVARYRTTAKGYYSDAMAQVRRHCSQSTAQLEGLFNG